MTKERAILAGGCFWGMEALICNLPGVLDTTVGYTGGDAPNPTYENHTGHAEAIEILFDNELISYRTVLEFFFQIHDPTTKNRQGNDMGSSYRSAVFYLSEAQKLTAETLIAEMTTSRQWPGSIVTEVTAASEFYTAEAYHQDYLKRNPNGYTCHFVRPTWKVS
jgi:peptide-methionine (S)-S-oxide reductase